MTIGNTASASSRLKDESVLRTDLDRAAEERSENEGMAEHADKADGRFLGDFLSEREALDSAQAAVRSVVGGGGFASLSGAVDRPQTSRGGF
jgi:hypothetical protein